MYKGESQCYTLHELVESATGLAGDSYARNMTAPPGGQPVALAVSSEQDVRLKVRVAANRTVGCIHVVDWRNALPAVWIGDIAPKENYPPVTVNVSNAILAPAMAKRLGTAAAGCGKLDFVLHHLNSSKASEAVQGVCIGAVTVLTVPSPVPWSLLEIRPKAPTRA